MLRSVSLAITRGQIACLLGPNGAGKTTLIRTILGIVKPVSGSIWFEGQRIDALRTHQIVARGIAVVPEGRRVFPRMTVEENLRMGAFVEWTARDLAGRRDHVFSLFPRLGERRRQTAESAFRNRESSGLKRTASRHAASASSHRPCLARAWPSRAWASAWSGLRRIASR